MSDKSHLRVVCVFAWTVLCATALAGGPNPDLLWWTFDEGTGDVATDNSGSGHDGVISGATWRLGGADGLGYCLNFGGDGDMVDDEEADAYLNGLDAVTFSLWIKSNLVGTDKGFLWFYEPDSGDSGGLRYDAASWKWPGGTNIVKGSMGVSGGLQTIEGSSNKQTTEWQHIAMTWSSGNRLSLYVDGELENAPTGEDPPRTGTVSGVTKLLAGKGGKDNAPDLGWDGLIDDVRIYSRELSQAEILQIMQGSSARSSAPDPASDATDVPRDVVLSWTPGQFAQTHDIYLGTAFDDVNDASRADPMGVLVSQGQAAATYDPPGLLDLERTYYWRVDEVNAPPASTIFKGNVWSFTTEPLAYPVENVVATASASDAGAGPENTINGSGLNAADQHSVNNTDMWLATSNGVDPIWIQYEFERVQKMYELWVWNYNVIFEPVLGFGLKDVTIEYSEDGANWLVLGDYEFTQGTATDAYDHNTTIDLGGIAAKYIRFVVSDNWGMLTQYGLSEVRFFYIPTAAREPQPEPGAVDVDVDTVLDWRAGRDAAEHVVYLDTDQAAVMDGTALGQTVVDSTFVPTSLNLGTTYYWRVDEVNDTASPAVWEGDVWRFSTREFVTVDDFESYTDNIDAGETIFDTWIDGWVNNNGSTVGYFDAPFAEQTIVHGGTQSMPLQYDNTASPWHSEASRTFDSAQDWAVSGANTLVLYFQGVPGPFAELPSGKIVMGAAGADIWNAADEFRFAYKPLNGDGSIVARVESVANTNVWAKGGVMIRETLDAGSAFAAVYGTPGNGCRYQARLATDAAAVSDTSVATAEQIAMIMPYWVKIERTGSSFNGYYSTDGQNWTAMSWNPQTIAMGANVYIGLAVTSHSAGVLASAEFSGVVTTGDVTGQWAVETIGPDQPEGNAPAPLYVTLEDATGKTATVSHPSGDVAALLGGWNEWQIPLSQFTGINLSRIEAMIIGLGNRANPTAGGSGIVYVDDIAFGRPATAQ